MFDAISVGQLHVGGFSKNCTVLKIVINIIPVLAFAKGNFLAE